jgi:hypothetical protein
VYKFYIENSSGNGWENSIDNRVFGLLQNVQTLQWQYFDKSGGSTPVNDERLLPETTRLYPNYPNPFNPSTMIQYSIPVVEALSAVEGLVNSSEGTGYTNVQLKVYDILGKEIATLVNQQQSPGIFSVMWNASEQTNGIYFIRLVVNDKVFTKKAVLLK